MFTDPILKTLSKKYPKPTWKDRSEDLFENLIKTIISQQLSVKAADTIFGRFKKLFHSDLQTFPTPKEILAIPDEQFRSVGISGAKTKYIKHIAENFANGNMTIEKIKHLSDEAVMEELIKLKGVGKWSAEMTLMFTLNRPDIFSLGDAGLKRAIKNLYNIETDTEILRLSETWKPHRSLACWYLWQSLDNKV